MRDAGGGGSRLGRALLLALGVVGTAACGPRGVIQDYTLRRNELFFAVQQGESYQVGDCRRDEAGQLTMCRLYRVDFK
jgi:hypothetical protein